MITPMPFDVLFDTYNVWSFQFNLSCVNYSKKFCYVDLSNRCTFDFDIQICAVFLI